MGVNCAFLGIGLEADLTLGTTKVVTKVHLADSLWRQKIIVWYQLLQFCLFWISTCFQLLVVLSITLHPIATYLFSIEFMNLIVSFCIVIVVDLPGYYAYSDFLLCIFRLFSVVKMFNLKA